MRLYWIAILCVIVSVELLPAAIVHYVQDSVNDVDSSPIAAVSSDAWLETAIKYSTVTAPADYSGYRFVYWSNDSYSGNLYRDAWGRSKNPISFVLLEDTTATAHYLPTTVDTDIDGVPDWFEIEYYNALTNASLSDTDGDGFTLSQEHGNGTHPLYGNSSQDGGVFWAGSGLVTVNLAGYSKYTFTSDPAGTVDISAVVPVDTVVDSPDLANNSSFGYWELDGIRQDDLWGVSYPQISFVVQSNDRIGVAYLFAGDSDDDSVPDAYEQYHYGTLSNTGESDSDGDGITMLTEYADGTSPLYGNSSQAGGVFYADSELVTVNLAGFSHYILRSEPAGAVDISEVVPDGTEITSPDMSQSYFGYWRLDGVRQEDAWGVAQRQFRFIVDGVNREGVASLFDQDSDGDGVNDGIEYYFYNSLTNNAGSDTDGDGIPLLMDSQPLYGNSSAEGGVFWDDSELVVVNLQPFERSEYVLSGGALTNFFTIWPRNTTGIDFGIDSAPALGDWDGDGDIDLFVTARGMPLSVFENVGSAYRLDLIEHSAAFISLGVFAGNPALGDWNGDAKADLAVGSSTGAVRIMSSCGSFSDLLFAVDYIVNTGSSNAIPAFGELTGDGLVDLLVLLDDGTLRLYPNSGSPATPFDGGVFFANWHGITVQDGTGLAVADINSDDIADILISDNDGRILEFHGSAAGNYTLMSKVWGGSCNGFASRLTLTADDLDGDGDTDAVCGYSGGGLIYLNDPRIGLPSNLQAFNGAESILLNWNPNRHFRFRGYNIYRAEQLDGTFVKISGQLVPFTEYRDYAVTAGVTYYYYVVAVSGAMYPGNSTEILVESPPSEIVEANIGAVEIWMPDYTQVAGKVAVLQINVRHGTDIAGNNMEIRLTYDPDILTPVSQLVATNKTVENTILTKDIVFSDNAATASNELIITGTSGNVSGEGHLFDINFMVSQSAPIDSRSTNTFSYIALSGTSGHPLTVDYSDIGILTVQGSGGGYFLGDINGDGVLDINDKAHLMWLLRKKTRDPTEEEIRAGDINGDGKLSHKDIAPLLRLIHGRSQNPE